MEYYPSIILVHEDLTMSLWQIKLESDNKTLLQYDSIPCLKQCTSLNRKL